MSPTAITSVQDLRRITEAVDQLRDRHVQDVKIRSDCRQLRIMLEDGRTLLVSVVDEGGVSRLDVDVLHMPEQHSRSQLEVHFKAET
ncbi:MAG: hypothetical protein O7I93_03225 [Gemmatimonadetes bacterium]|nr:hypothetical protein [Gemmatimonadota bacterium]